MKSYDVYHVDDQGYHKLFHHQSWRIAILNYIEELEAKAIQYVEAHEKTDEVFVLLQGKCTLILADVLNQRILSFDRVEMEPNKIYRIPKGIFHTHSLSRDAKVLIIEVENTSYENSLRIYLDSCHKEWLNQKE